MNLWDGLVGTMMVLVLGAFEEIEVVVAATRV